MNSQALSCSIAKCYLTRFSFGQQALPYGDSDHFRNDHFHFLAIFPTTGPSSLYDLTDEWLWLWLSAVHPVLGPSHGKDVTSLMREGVPLLTPKDIRGLIAFPSYHTVLALAATYYAQRRVVALAVVSRAQSCCPPGSACARRPPPRRYSCRHGGIPACRIRSAKDVSQAGRLDDKDSPSTSTVIHGAEHGAVDSAGTIVAILIYWKLFTIY